jgi:thiol:disulfide interchange protein DsbD
VKQGLVSAALLAVLGAAAGDAVGADGQHVRARLVVDSAELTPGGSLHLGVLFELDPGWHIYWRYPGDSGVSTDIRFALPAGFEAGELRWPLPISFTQPGDLIAYGYEGGALLAAELLVPERLPDDGLELRAEVSWLACKNVCVLGSAELSERLPVPAGAVAEAAFAGWSASLPLPDADDARPFSLTATGGIADGESSGELALWLHWSTPPASVEFFPDAGDNLKISKLELKSRGSVTRIDLRLRRIGGGDSPADSLPSLVVATAPDGRRVGYELPIPLT